MRKPCFCRAIFSPLMSPFRAAAQSRTRITSPRARFLHPFSSLEFWFPPLYPPDSLVASHHQVLLKPGQDLRKLCSGLFPTYEEKNMKQRLGLPVALVL